MKKNRGVERNKENASSDGEGFSRRDFMRAGALGAGAAAATLGATSKSFAAPVMDIDIPSIRIPSEIPDTLSEAENVGSFEGNGMSGAEVFAKLCKHEKLAGLFCCPGNYTVINAIAAAGLIKP